LKLSNQKEREQREGGRRQQFRSGGKWQIRCSSTGVTKTKGMYREQEAIRKQREGGGASEKREKNFL